MALGELAMLTEGLEPGCLLVGVLVYFDGYTQEEISASLDVSRRTVGKRLKKFRRHVDKRRTILKTKEIDDALVGVRNGR